MFHHWPGRNVIQHANPAGMTRALMAIVHDNATAEAAAEILREK
jgi:fructose-bisphosphate aldolase, class I